MKGIVHKKFIFIFGGVIALIPMVASLFRCQIAPDSAYYLIMVERMAEGYIPYKTLNLGYTPLWFYIMLLLKKLFLIPYGAYEVYLFFHYLFVVGIAWSMYKIARLFGCSTIISYLGAWTFVVYSHWLYGNIVLLEIPSMFWGILSAWLLLKMKEKRQYNIIVISGIFCAFSFLTKQFGLGFMVLGLFLVFFQSGFKWQKCILFIVSFFIPLLLCWIIWKDSFVSLIFSDYGTVSAEEAGWDISLSTKLNQIASSLWLFVWRIFPFLFVLPLILFFEKSLTKPEFINIIWCVCGILGFSLQFYFVKCDYHYMLYMLPFAILIMCIVISSVSNKSVRYVTYVFGFVMIVIIVYSTFWNRVYKQYIKLNDKQEQRVTADKVNEILNGDSRDIWIANSHLFFIYYLSNLYPPNVSTIGYSFGPLGLNEDDALEQISSSDYVICLTEKVSSETYFSDSLKNSLEVYPVVSIDDASVLIYCLKNSKY